LRGRRGNLEIDPFFRVGEDRIGWTDCCCCNRGFLSVSIEVVCSSGDSGNGDWNHEIGAFLRGRERRIETLGEVSIGQLRVMGYLECGAGRGFERLEEKRTSREHVVMDALMSEGAKGWR
jgi:hypothetical protein